MSLRKTIRKVLKENTQEKIQKLVDEMGVVKACKYFGGYDELKKLGGELIISNEQKIDVITDYVFSNEMGVSLRNFSDGEIFYKTEKGEYQEIAYLTFYGAVVDIYDILQENSLGEYEIPYYDLPIDILDKIFKKILVKV